MAGRLKGKVAVVTAAGQGIGRAIAEAFVAEGATVYATDKDFADYRLQDAALIERARLAVHRAMPLIELARQSATADAEEAVAA